jgi:hypothetical protein
LRNPLSDDRHASERAESADHASYRAASPAAESP